MKTPADGVVEMLRNIAAEDEDRSDDERRLLRIFAGTIEIELKSLREAVILLTPENWDEDEDWVRILAEHGLTPNAQVNRRAGFMARPVEPVFSSQRHEGDA